MKLNFGKHQGSSVAEIFFKDPGYIRWLMNTTATGQMLAAQKVARELVGKFDSKPIDRSCHAVGCGKGASRASIYRDSLDPFWWCETCDPSQAGASDGKIQIIRTFEEALAHVEYYCKGKKSDEILAIKFLARGKGLPTRITASARAAFFR